MMILKFQSWLVRHHAQFQFLKFITAICIPIVLQLASMLYTKDTGQKMKTVLHTKRLHYYFVYIFIRKIVSWRGKSMHVKCKQPGWNLIAILVVLLARNSKLINRGPI